MQICFPIALSSIYVKSKAWKKMFHTWPSSHVFLVHTTTPHSNMTNQFTQTQPVSHVTTIFTWDRLVPMTTSHSHDVMTTPLTRSHPMDISPVYTWPGGYGTEKMFRQYLPSCHILTKSIKWFAVLTRNMKIQSVTLAFRPGVGEGNSKIRI